ncbi:MAG: hypothetical protein M3Q99_17340 [Acidobacteriota bacterium]|nr:hypothetical protein [Acidobacteriota bacterium]
MYRNLILFSIMFLCLPVTMLPQSQENNSGQKLSEVAHDATLTGKGTNASPLSIANGAVTSTKLDTVNAPQTGQVLSFNGSALSWQTPTAAPTMGSALRVVDSNGAQVGLLDSSSNAIRYMSSLDIWLRFTIDKKGIGNILSTANIGRDGTPPSSFAVFYDEINCQGQAYMAVGNSLLVDARVIGENAYFPSGPGEITSIKSFGSLLRTSCSFGGNGGSIPLDHLSPMQTVPISSFGTPPFKVTQ